MKYVKLFEGFLSEKESDEEVDSFGNKKKKKKDEEDPGTVLSNTTGIVTAMEVTEAKNEDISKWDDKRVNKIYGYYLDGLSNAERETEEKKKLSVDKKREVLKKQQVKFEKQFEGFLSEAEVNENKNTYPSHWTKDDVITVNAIKISLEDYESQGGKITKTLIKDSIKEFKVDAKIKNEVQSELEGIYL